MNVQLQQALQLETPFKIIIKWVGPELFKPDYGDISSIGAGDVIGYFDTEGLPSIGYVCKIMTQSTGIFVRKMPSLVAGQNTFAKEESVPDMMIICKFISCQ